MREERGFERREGASADCFISVRKRMGDSRGTAHWEHTSIIRMYESEERFMKRRTMSCEYGVSPQQG